MIPLRVAWRRAVGADAEADGPSLSDLLTSLGPAAAASNWMCDGIEATGPLADHLLLEAASGPVLGTILVALSIGITRTLRGVFEATRPGDDRPWLSVRVADGGQFVVATRDRALLDELRSRFRDSPASVGSALGDD